MKVNIMFIGVGGQGILTTIGILGEAAVASGLNVIMSEVHGMAQRGGTVEAHVRMGDVHSPLIPDRGADVLVAFEPAEGLKALRKVSPHGIILTNTSPIYPFTVSLGMEEYPEVEDILNEMKRYASRVIAMDALDMAIACGSALSLNMVMLGALTGTGVLPMDVKSIRDAISLRIPEKYVDTAMKAFDAGLDRCTEIVVNGYAQD